MADVPVDDTIVPPIDSDVLIHAGALGSVGTGRLPKLLTRAQAYLADDLDFYRREYECVHEDDERAVFLVPEDHWEQLQDPVPLGPRAADAVRRAHEQQLRRIGTGTDRREEFETALEIRSAVVIGLDEAGGNEGDRDSKGDRDRDSQPHRDSKGDRDRNSDPDSEHDTDPAGTESG